MAGNQTKQTCQWSNNWKHPLEWKKRLRKILPNDTSSRHCWNWFSNLFFKHIMTFQPLQKNSCRRMTNLNQHENEGRTRCFGILGFNENTFLFTAKLCEPSDVFCLNLRRIFAKHHLRRVEVMVRGEIWYGMSIDDLSVCGQHPGPTFPSKYLDTKQCQNAA